MSEPAVQRARAHVRLRGRVQGVGFRFAVQHQAERHGLDGWVRNLDDGQVEAVFEGSREAVVQMVAWCRQGPPGARVQDLLAIWDEPIEHLHGFAIRPTGFGFGTG